MTAISSAVSTAVSGPRSGTVSGVETVRPLRRAEVASWDVETGVVVVGGGAAGLCAAIEAREAGAEVTLLERASGVGGATAMAGGVIYLGGGTDLQRRCGVTDTPEAMFDFLVAALGPGVDEERLRVYCEGSVEHYDWLVRQGVPFKPTLFEGERTHPDNDDGLMWLGEDAAPFAELARPAPRGHHPQQADWAGGKLTGVLTEVAHRLGVEVTTDARVTRLVVEDDGAVVGVVARRFGVDRSYAARAVVLAAGGFVFNEEMLARHAPLARGHAKVGTDHDDGRAIRIAQAAGAATRHMDAIECAPWTSVALLARSICVNGAGQRFVNEDTYHGIVGQRILQAQAGQAYLVFDQRVFESLGPRVLGSIRPTWVCETVGELEAEMGLPTHSLQSTVDLYNRHARAGGDPVFGKRAEYVAPLEPPYAAIDMRAKPFRADGRTGYLVFTLGGLLTDVDGRVLDLDGRAMPGLYAAGRTASGLSGSGYISGTSIGDASFFGRRAGRAAATR